jgi:hypothetical protein
MHVNFDTTVLGGFPVSVDAEIEPPDPSVGYYGFGVAEYTLSSVKTGKPFGKWLYTRVQGVRGEEQKLFDEILQSFGENCE